MESDPDVLEDQISRKVKYLGIILGHDTLDDNWAAPLKKYIDAVICLLNLDCGLTTTIALYNMLAISKLSFVAAFFLPSKLAEKTEEWGLQKILRGPWNAIPSRALFDFCDIGIKPCARSLFEVARSSQVRSANLTSNCFFSMYHQHLRSLESNEITVAALNKLHLKDSFFFNWFSKTNEYLELIKELEEPIPISKFSQRNVLKKFAETRNRSDFRHSIINHI